jgi:TolB protein
MSQLHIKFLKLSFSLCIFLVSTPSFALLEIEITQGVESALPIAITSVAGDASIEGALIGSVVHSDLYGSGLFAIVDRKSYPQQPRSENELDYEKWRDKGIESLLIMSVNRNGADQYNIQFQLFDLVRKRRSFGHSVTAKKSILRRVAHKIADVVFEELTGIKGAFSTRIAYISESKAGTGKQHRLQIADADGFNEHTIFASSKTLLSPAWSPDGRQLAYVSFENDRSEIFIHNIGTGERAKISSKPGINSAPAWSPDGGRIALTLSAEGDPDIYVMEMSTRKLRKLTQHHGIDTEPAWTPDGRFILFTSNRSGSPQVYQVPASGGTPKRLTFDGNYNAAPTVSADGKLVAMVHNGGQGYRIGILDLQRNNFRLITNGTLDEAPSFAPNGSMIIYSTRDNKNTVLSAVSADGRVQQRLRLQGGKVREPAWSPFR